MASTDASQLTAAVLIDGRAYPMFAVGALEDRSARLGGPLLLEIGEQVELRLARGAVTVEVTATVREVVRGADPAIVVAFTAEVAAKLAPLRAR